MSVTAGALSQVSVTDTQAVLSSAAATAGTGPYTYQWYRSTTTGFTPGGGNILSGKTSLSLTDTGLIPGTQYYYKVVATDTGASSATSTSSQLAVATSAPSQAQNAFLQSAQLGIIDLRFPYNTVAVQIDASQATALYAGAAVKMVDSADGVPKVVGCAANSDEVLGFINFDIKSPSFAAGAAAEISMSGNVMYLYATGAIGRGVQVSLDLSTNGGVRAAAGNTGDKIVGWAYDKAAAGGLFRVFLKTPSFTVV
jgi:hypothetical protein